MKIFEKFRFRGAWLWITGLCDSLYQLFQIDTNFCEEFVHQFRLKTVFVRDVGKDFLPLSYSLLFVPESDSGARDKVQISSAI